MPAHAIRTHAVLSASSADRWLNCTASVKLIQTAGPKVRISNIYADRGTALHQASEQAIIEAVEPEVGMKITVRDDFVYELDQEDVDGLEIYLSYIRALIDRAYSFRMEVPLNSLREYHEDLGGTLDVEVLTVEHEDNGEYPLPEGFVLGQDMILHINDLKSGRGKPVYAEKNLQALQYATGAYNGLEPEVRDRVKVIRICIVQPWNQAVRDLDVWDCYPHDLIEYGSRIMTAAQEATLGGVFKLGPWCQYCPVQGVCPEIRKGTTEMLKDMTIKDKFPVNPDNLSLETISKLLLIYEVVKPWFKSLHAYASAQAEAGVVFPDLELKPKRARYDWEDKEYAVAQLLEMGLKKSQIYELKMKSPSKVKAEIKGQKELITLVEGLYHNTATGYNLVPSAAAKGESPQVPLLEFTNPLLTND